MFAVKLLMATIITSVSLTSYLIAIILFHVQEIKQLNFGKLAQVLILVHIMDIKNGSEMSLSQQTVKSWQVALMIKVYVYGKSINKHLSIDILHMTMLLKPCLLFKVNKVNNWWILNFWNLSSHNKVK